MVSPNTSGNSDILSPLQQSPSNFGNQSMHHHASHSALVASVKNKFAGSTKDLKSKSADQPPPLPQRNITRRSQPVSTLAFDDSRRSSDGIDGDGRRNTSQISDLDHMLNLSTSLTSGGSSSHPTKHTHDNSVNNNNNSFYASNRLGVGREACSDSNDSTGKCKTPSAKSSSSSASANKVKKRNKTKSKANSDPKISAQLFIQAERDYDKQDLIAATGHSVANEPPPLPPRQPGMLEENQNMLNNNKCSNRSGSENRPSPNSLETRMNYPLIATATAVRDNISPFPLSNRPNIKQRLQQNSHQHNTSATSSSTNSSVSKSCVSNFHLCHVQYESQTQPSFIENIHTTHAHIHLPIHTLTKRSFDSYMYIPMSSYYTHNEDIFK